MFTNPKGLRARSRELKKSLLLKHEKAVKELSIQVHLLGILSFTVLDPLCIRLLCNSIVSSTQRNTIFLFLIWMLSELRERE